MLLYGSVRTLSTWALLLLQGVATALRVNHKQRDLGEMVVTTACSSIRSQSYEARIDIGYLYVVEFETGTDVDLSSFDRSIANAIAMALYDCDVRDQPLYAVEWTSDGTGHVFSTGGKYMREIWNQR